MRTLWRLHIRPSGGKGDVAASVAFCLKNEIVGMGWPVPEEASLRSSDLEWYKQAAVREYQTDESWHSVWTFAEQPAIGDLIWFRSTEGRYFLAEILSPWEYAYDDDAAIDVDIVNFRKARIIDIGLCDAVPGKIIACFRPSRTFQPIRSPGMLNFSEKLAGLPLSGAPIFDLFEFMSDVDLENVVFIYLQVLGWYVLPGTRTATTAHYEFVLVHRETGEKAVTQVKSGETWIDASRYSGTEKAFLFAASQQYGSIIPRNVVLITRHQLIAFIQDHRYLLPQAINTWIDIAGLSVDAA
jgi:hypothetical protein